MSNVRPHSGRIQAFAAVALAVAALGTGCRAPAGPTSAGPADGDGVRRVPRRSAVRIAAGDASLARAIARRDAWPAVGDVRRRGNCWTARPSRAARRAGLRPADWAQAWTASIGGRRPGDWLLEDVDGARAYRLGEVDRPAGLTATATAVEVCVAWTARDLPQRLAHPALWVAPSESRGGLRGRELDFEPVDVGGDAMLALALDRIDAAALHARRERRWEAVRVGLDPAAVSRIAVRDAPAWDRGWALTVSPRRRWVNDPTLRRWLDRALDRPALAAALGETARPRRTFPSGDPRGPDDAASAGPQAPGPRPLSATSRPRLTLAWAEDDPDAAVLAATLLARAEAWGVELRGRSLAPAALEAAVAGDETDLALVAYAAGIEDPVLRLLTLLRRVPLGAAAAEDEALDLLRGASRLSDPRARRDAARRAAESLALAGTRIPLIFEPARIAFRTDRVTFAGAPVVGVLRIRVRGTP